MKDRIRKIRKDLDLNQTEFGAEIGATQKMVTTFETGRVVPDKPIIMLICEKFHVNQTWLETGEGEPYKVSPNYSILRALDAMPDLQDAFAAVLPELTVQDIKNINDLLKKFKKALGK
jgi:DNA-binding XRE family transcriptional regulator